MQFFVVFHRKLFDECYEKIPPDILRKYFTFFAVNQSIPKEYTPGKYKILNEWDLPIYDPTMQQRDYRENSAIYHVYANGLHKKYERIGFFQYDMKFNENIVTKILDIPSTEPFGFAIAGLGMHQFHERDPPEVGNKLKEVIVLYESDFGKKILKTIKTKFPPYAVYSVPAPCVCPLLNSYVVPIQSFERVMKWVAGLYSKIDVPGHTAGLYEAIMGIALGAEDLAWMPLNIQHDQDLKKPCY